VTTTEFPLAIRANGRTVSSTGHEMNVADVDARYTIIARREFAHWELASKWRAVHINKRAGRSRRRTGSSHS
jgi:hypothetical protein